MEYSVKTIIIIYPLYYCMQSNSVAGKIFREGGGGGGGRVAFEKILFLSVKRNERERRRKKTCVEDVSGGVTPTVSLVSV